jgi:hypothetical protein
MAQVVDGRSLEYTKILQYIIITHMAQVVDGRSLKYTKILQYIIYYYTHGTGSGREIVPLGAAKATHFFVR